MSSLFRFWKISRFQFNTICTSVPVDLVKINQTKPDTFESEVLWAPYAERPVFGGLLTAHSVAAGLRTVSSDRLPNIVHSMYCIGGDLEKKVIYKVENLRDGKNSSMREIRGTQGDDLICTTIMSAMTEKLSDKNFCFEKETIKEDKYIPLNDYVANELISMENNIGCKKKYNELIKKQYYCSLKNLKILRNTFHIEIGSKTENKRQIKIRIVKDEVSQHDFSILLTLLSDMFTIETTLLNYDLNVFSKEVGVVCSIDHNINFMNCSMPKDNLVYYMIKCDYIYNSKAIIEGKIVNKEGEILCTTNQQALVKLKD